MPGAASDDIIEDYKLSPDPERAVLLARERSSVGNAIQRALSGLEIDKYLEMGGVGREELAVVRKRLAG
jgi:hypothetical protein